MASEREPSGREIHPAVRRTSRLVEVSIRGFLDDRCPQFAAAIAYFALFSLFPVAIVFTAAFGLLTADSTAQDRVVDFIVEQLPLSEDAGGNQVRSLLEGVSGNARALGVIGLAGVIYSASALMAAIRNSLNAVWGLDETRSPLRGKALDILLVVGLGALIGLSLAATVLRRLVFQAGTDIGVDGSLLGVGFDIVGFVVPILLSATVFAVLLRIVPATVHTLRDIWPGVVVATLGYELAKRGFSIYLEHFASYNAVYGSLGAVVALLVFVYVASMIFLLGAEHAAGWPRVRDETLDEPTAIERLPGSLWGRLRSIGDRIDPR